MRTGLACAGGKAGRPFFAAAATAAAGAGGLLTVVLVVVSLAGGVAADLSGGASTESFAAEGGALLSMFFVSTLAPPCDCGDGAGVGCPCGSCAERITSSRLKFCLMRAVVPG